MYVTRMLFQNQLMLNSQLLNFTISSVQYLITFYIVTDLRLDIITIELTSQRQVAKELKGIKQAVKFQELTQD